MKNEDIEIWRKLVEAYFDGETTDEEEKLLKQFLMTSDAEGKEFDEARAVMGFFQVGKQINTVKKHRASYSIGRRVRWIAAAACLLLLCAGGIRYVMMEQSDCVAYIGGKKCTDEIEVLAQMHLAMRQVDISEGEASVDSQLKDIFQSMNDMESNQEQ